MLRGLLQAVTLLLAGIALGHAALPATATDPMVPPSTEYEQKARIIVTLAKLAHWPDEVLGAPDAPFQLCTLGKDPFGPTWQPFEQGRVHGHKFLTRRINITELDGCAIVFIGLSEVTRVDRYLRMLADRPVMAVSEADGFVDAGGTVELLLINNEVKFKLNRNAGRAEARPYLPTSTIRSAINYNELRK